MDCVPVLTLIVNFMTFVAIAVTAVIYALQLAQMTRATQAAARSADAAIKTVVTMKETAEQQLRAYLQIVPTIAYSFDAYTPLKIEVVLENFGQTPAKQFWIRARCFMDSRAIDGSYQLPSIETEWVGPCEIYPNGTLAVKDKPKATHTENAPFSVEAIEGFRLKALHLHIVGEARYVDIFSNNRTCSFCFTVQPETALQYFELTDVASQKKHEIHVAMNPVGNNAT